MRKETILSLMEQHNPIILGSESFSKFSVLLPLIEIENELHLVYEVRAESLRRQPGEICFPGGKIDKTDESPQFAAIRETTEELKVNSNQIESVYPLNYLVSPYGMIVYPFVGFLTVNELPAPNEDEVSEVFTVPLSHFLSTEPAIHKVEFEAHPEENFPYELVPGGKNYTFRKRVYEEYFYPYKSYSIWGLTARITAEFVKLLKQQQSERDV
ncbi:NUDIX hydrolase [Mangrovibacillus cuniculi]|uniref:CoA pyrophosphatase n=1 Tax=Mangrovibacillus cuniculi TaxID=2593652 RepID=A0A7S8CAQ7_9BACI|nr:CoA pyrophosphatase [Mangrovibacillus cuniculi]QPC46503.1 CoA pyrophosphatase [Mangrovibacillus cuniculi]